MFVLLFHCLLRIKYILHFYLAITSSNLSVPKAKYWVQDLPQFSAKVRQLIGRLTARKSQIEANTMLVTQAFPHHYNTQWG